jgi:hypothetical protein
VIFGSSEYCVAVHDRAAGAEVVAYKAEHTSQARLAHSPCNRRHTALRSRAGVHYRCESAAEAFQGRRLRGQIDELVVEHAFERHPNAAEYLGRFPEGERFAEGLSEMMMRIDEARHEQMARQRDRRDIGMARPHSRLRSDIAESSIANYNGVPGDRPVA